MGTVITLPARNGRGPRWPKTDRSQTQRTDGVDLVRWGTGWQVANTLIGFEKTEGGQSYVVLAAHLPDDHPDHLFTGGRTIARTVAEIRRRGLIPTAPEEAS